MSRLSSCSSTCESSPIWRTPECMRRNGSLRSPASVMMPSRNGRSTSTRRCSAWLTTACSVLATPRPAQTRPYSTQNPVRYSVSPITPAWGRFCKYARVRWRRACLRVRRFQALTVRRQRTSSSQSAKRPGPLRCLRRVLSSSWDVFKGVLLPAPGACIEKSADIRPPAKRAALRPAAGRRRRGPTPYRPVPGSKTPAPAR